MNSQILQSFLLKTPFVLFQPISINYKQFYVPLFLHYEFRHSFSLESDFLNKNIVKSNNSIKNGINLKMNHNFIYQKNES